MLRTRMGRPVSKGAPVNPDHACACVLAKNTRPGPLRLNDCDVSACRLGYRCTCFTDTAAALHEFRGAPHDFDAVITDLQMPTISGIDLVRAIRSMRADTPVAVVSGYPPEHIATDLDAQFRTMAEQARHACRPRRDCAPPRRRVLGVAGAGAWCGALRITKVGSLATTETTPNFWPHSKPRERPMRRDVYIENDSGGFSVVAADTVDAIIEDARSDDAGFVTSYKALLLMLYGDDSLPVRIAVDEPLDPDEEAQWLARVSWRIDTSDARILVMGGFDPDVLSWWKDDHGGQGDGRGVAEFQAAPGSWRVDV